MLAELDAEEALRARSKDKRSKGGKGGKKKKGVGSEQTASHAERKQELASMVNGGGKEGKEEEEEEKKETGGGDGQPQVGRQQREEGDDGMVADLAASTVSMTLAEGKGNEAAELEASGTSKDDEPAAIDFLEDAPDEYVCPLEMCLMTEEPVVASDGFVYSKMGLEGWIAHCAAKGLPLTSPRTGLPMGDAFMLNMTHRTLVREWVEKRKEMGKR